MGLFTPKYPQGAEPPHRESRADRKSRERTEALDKDLTARFKAAQRESKERSARFWDDYERRNGPGSVDWS
ncbi:hypothetical protein [Streptomyces roseifaciens]|uniref:hypothetical protein n=1 Tax=Streptomyces roseifaciens TaxID=1488406 RepID=UPI0007182DBE|nr:hypothetical protein [Streptomyces roseifaciens]